MTYKIVIKEEAKKELEKITQTDRERIIKYLAKNIATTNNPRSFGKALIGDKSGSWRYRVGNYRIICDIYDRECVVETIHIGHRSKIYDMF
jgi:mRNA interferase RelE/StbE